MYPSTSFIVTPIPVFLKNRSHPILFIHSRILSSGSADFLQASRICTTAETASSHLGGVFGRYGITILPRSGPRPVLEALPPTDTAKPSSFGSPVSIASHFMVQAPQWMHRSALIETLFSPLTLIAPVGQQARTVGRSQICI